jgi:hypothetical protein
MCEQESGRFCCEMFAGELEVVVAAEVVPVSKLVENMSEAHFFWNACLRALSPDVLGHDNVLM